MTARPAPASGPARARARARNVAAALAAGAGGVVLSARIAAGPPILAGRWALLGALAVWAGGWAAGTAAVLRLPPRLGVALSLAIGLALRLAALAGPPTTSDDLYRYAWDGRVQAAGIDAYRHPPEAPALAGLREPWLWPDDGGCADLRRAPGCTRINRPGQPTIYPPVAEAWFAAVHRVAGADARHKAWQVAGLVTELGVLALLPVALARWGRDPRWTALYALSPAPVLEVVGNGHVDGLAVLLVVAALVVVAPASGDRCPRPPPLQVTARLAAAGALVGAATLVKLLPAALLVAMAGGAGVGRRRRALAPAALGAIGVAVAAYLPHVLAVGWRVLGYLPGYLQEERYDSGGRFLLATAAGLPGWAAGAASVAAVAAVAGWVALRRPPPPVAAALVLGALLLAVSPVQPWYAVALLAVATVAGRPRWVVVVAAGYPYFWAVILDHPHAAAIGRLSYGVALTVVLAAHAAARWPWLIRGGRRPRRAGMAEPILLAGSGALHLAAALAHRDSPLGVAFFLAVGVLQVAAALRLSSRPSARLRAGVVVGMVLVVGLWAASRTVGLPVVDEFARPEPAGVLDLLAVGTQGAAVASILAGRPGGRVPGGRPAPPVVLASAAAVLAAAVALVPPAAGHPHRGPSPEAARVAPDDGHSHGLPDHHAPRAASVRK